MSPRGAFTDEQKAAASVAQRERHAVAAYLDALDGARPKRGRRRTPESIDKRLAKIDEELVSASSLTRLQLVQERLDLLAERSSMGEEVDLAPVEEAFVAAARSYSERKGISYAAWRELGVPADVLKKAGISRGS